MQITPNTYYITDHYKNYPYVLVRMSDVDLEEPRGHMLKAWKTYVTKSREGSVPKH